jgi:hypothetical protein
VDDETCHADRSVGCHLLWAKSSTFIAFLPKLGCSIYSNSVRDKIENWSIANLVEDRHLINIRIMNVFCWKLLHRNSPRIPPKRKTSNCSPSSGASSLVADGSNKHTRLLVSANRISTLRLSAVNPGADVRVVGSARLVGIDESKNFDPASCDSLAMVKYSNSDQGPSSSSRCSTTYVLAGAAIEFDQAT